MKIVLSKGNWESIGQEAGWLKLSYEVPDSTNPFWKEVDKNTAIVGKIKTVADAKRMRGNSLPKPGEESLVDTGIVTRNGIPKKYQTYLQNNSGAFRVWTWIEV